jgi:ABC-type branched-subunit amino acid transport system permease subunit
LPVNLALPLIGIGLTGLLVLPHVVGARLPSSMAALGFVPIFASLALLVRISGQVSLCQLSFAAIGAASYGHLHAWGVPFPLAVLAAGLLAAPVGAVIAVPAIRLSGVYLAIATFGFGILVERMAFPAGFLFGYGQRIAAPRPSFAGGDIAYYHVLLAVAVAAVAVVVIVRRTRLGRLLRSLADSPLAFTAAGLNATVVRTMAFCLSAFLAGVGGAVIGPVTGTASAGVFNFGVSLTLVAVLYVVGSRPVVAPFAAAALYLVLPSYLTGGRVGDYLQIGFGAAALLAACGVVGAVVRAVDRSPRMTERSRRTSPARSRLGAVH